MGSFAPGECRGVPPASATGWTTARSGCMSPSQPSPAEGDGRTNDATGPYLGTRPDASLVPAPTPSLGQLGRFELRAMLGEGGFGRVYRAFDPNLDREVAIKVPILSADQPALLERFRREARA